MIDKYYQKHKERLWKEACERYQNVPGNVVLEYMKNYYLGHKNVIAKSLNKIL